MPDDASPFDPNTLAPRESSPPPPTSSPARSALGEADILGRYDVIEKRREETEAARRAEMEPALDRASAEVAKPYPKPPKMQTIGPPPKAQLEQNMFGFMSTAMVLGA